jgi:penicillin V acylase-like amidase (Ntn superfamily)
MIFSLAVALAAVRPADACTTFLLERGAERVVGKSYDWHMGQGVVMVNKRGVAKQSLPGRPGDRPTRWVSRHASVTFNQYGRELPNGGMNDAGLVVEIMWLDDSVYEKPDQRPSLNELQWIQYHLDSHGSVAEMVATAAQQRVSPLYAAVHYLACDKTGACAAFEYLGGKLVVTPGAKTLTNHSYAESVAWAAKQRELPRGMGSRERFARASRQVGAPATAEPIAAAFAILDGVRSSASQWNIVYDPVHMRVHFRTRSSPAIKTLDASKLDPSCASAVTLLDIDTDAGGDIAARLRPYDEATNRNLIERSVRRIRKQLPPGSIEALVAYPSALACAAP